MCVCFVVGGVGCFVGGFCFVLDVFFVLLVFLLQIENVEGF